MSFGNFGSVGTFGSVGNKTNSTTPAFGSTFNNNNQQNSGMNAPQQMNQPPKVNGIVSILQGYKHMYLIDKWLME